MVGGPGFCDIARRPIPIAGLAPVQQASIAAKCRLRDHGTGGALRWLLRQRWLVVPRWLVQAPYDLGRCWSMRRCIKRSDAKVQRAVHAGREEPALDLLRLHHFRFLLSVGYLLVGSALRRGHRSRA